jgi:hypothetical protein
VKHKVRREERLAVTGVRRTSDAVAEAVFVARAARRFVGRLRLRRGLDRELIDQLEERLAELPRRRRGSVS